MQAHCGEPQSHLPSRTSSGAHTPTQSKKRKAPAAALKAGGRPKLARPEGVAPCPRCSSEETKFCYYNNYNVGQPRYFCKVRRSVSSVLSCRPGPCGYCNDMYDIFEG